MGKQNVLFPVETINRELDFRIMLAAMLVRPDNRIFIGQHDVLHRLADFMKNGIYLGKNVFPNVVGLETGERYERLKQRGFNLIYLDEEGGIFRGDEDNWARDLMTHIDVTRLEKDDFVCAWGEFQGGIYRMPNPKCVDHVRVTGHPRFDLYKPQFREYFREDVERIRAKYGRFVLINTNLSLSNPGPGIEFAFCRTNGWDVRNPERRIRHIAEYTFLCGVLHAFLALINRLSIDFPDLKIIVRPHPNEDFDFYQSIFKGIGNVLTVHEGPVGPWILASDVMIHNSCTTGIEAYLAGSKVIVYKTSDNPQFDIPLPNSVGTICKSENEVVAAVRAVMLEGRDIGQEELPERAVSVLANLTKDSFQQVREVFGECQAHVRGASSFREREFSSTDVLRVVKQRAKDLVRPHIPKHMRKASQGPAWARTFSRMFYGFREREVQRKLAAALRIVKGNARLRFHGPELFSIESD